MENSLRAAYAMNVLEFHQENTMNDAPYDDLHGALVDILTNLRHLCKIEGINFDGPLKTSRMHFEEETGS